MNKFARMLMQDGKNPYGSRGGYVRSDRGSDYGEDYAQGGRGGRDRGYDMGSDYARGGNRGGDRRSDYGDYGDYGDMARGRGRDRGEDYARRDRGSDYASYNDRRSDYEGDYRRDRGEDYRRDMNDYGKPKLFSRKDMETWKSMMKNEDGTRGVHFREEQVKRACEQAGIDCEEFGEDVFCLAMNMMYSDYCKVAKKYGVDRPEYYADLSKAFLRDKDFDGKPEEKLYLYYKAIVEKDD